MYLKLKNTEINYYNNYSDTLILSEVVNSNMSYEFPVLVRSTEELDIWFGTENFEGKDYLSELLNSEVTLYLYKPTNPTPNTDSDLYIPYEDFNTSPIIYESIYLLPEIGEDDVKYSVISDNDELHYYIWLDTTYVPVDELPQNLQINDTISLSNRDTLRISSLSYNGPDYSYPDFKYGSSNEIIYTEVIDESLLSSHLPNLSDIKSKISTLAFSYDFSNVDSFEVSDTDEAPYIHIPSVTEDDIILWFRSDKYQEEPTGYNNTLLDLKKDYIEVTNRSKSEILSDIKTVLLKLGYQLKLINDDCWIGYQSGSLNVTYLYTLSNLIILPDFDTTHNILTKYIGNKSKLEFWARTIGHSEVDLINVEIVKYLNNEDGYRLTLTRGNYSEVYEGFVLGPDNIINKINSNSKLVYCRDLLYEDSELREGIWVLDRGKVEEISNSFYKKSINTIFNSEGIYFDYFLIPDMNRYISTPDPNFNYYVEYLDFINLSKELECQFLINNSTSDYKFNYIEDKDNRLLYFYDKITIQGLERPGFYVFISGILGGVYSNSVSNIVYNSPLENPYSDDNDLTKSLEMYKSNFLVNNNIIYYYRKYFNGEIFNTSIWMRFCLCKVYRELQKYKWKFLSVRNEGSIRSEIELILDNILNNYSIIDRITITNFNLDLLNYNLNLNIYTEMSDLVNKNINLNITLNFNKL